MSENGAGHLYYSDIWAIFWAINGRDSGHKNAKNHANERDIFVAVTLVYWPRPTEVDMTLEIIACDNHIRQKKMFKLKVTQKKKAKKEKVYQLQKPFSTEQNAAVVIQSLHAKLRILVALTKICDQIARCSFPVSHLY